MAPNLLKFGEDLKVVEILKDYSTIEGTKGHFFDLGAEIHGSNNL